MTVLMFTGLPCTTTVVGNGFSSSALLMARSGPSWGLSSAPKHHTIFHSLYFNTVEMSTSKYERLNNHWWVSEIGAGGRLWPFLGAVTLATASDGLYTFKRPTSNLESLKMHWWLCGIGRGGRREAVALPGGCHLQKSIKLFFIPSRRPPAFMNVQKTTGGSLGLGEEGGGRLWPFLGAVTCAEASRI
jgi:hypothetical protein